MKRFFSTKKSQISAEPLLQEEKQSEEFEKKAAEARKQATNLAKLKHLPEAIFKLSQDMEIPKDDTATRLHARLKEYFLAGGQVKNLQMPKAKLESQQHTLDRVILIIRSQALREAAAQMAPNYRTFAP